LAIQVLVMASKTLTSEKMLNENFAWWKFAGKTKVWLWRRLLNFYSERYGMAV
jgi:hypothetical protein